MNPWKFLILDFVAEMGFKYGMAEVVTIDTESCITAVSRFSEITPTFTSYISWFHVYKFLACVNIPKLIWASNIAGPSFKSTPSSCLKTYVSDTMNTIYESISLHFNTLVSQQFLQHDLSIIREFFGELCK